MPLPLIFDRDLILKLIGRRPAARVGGLIEKFRSFRQFLQLLPLRGRELFGIDFRGNLEARDPSGLLATHTHRFPPPENPWVRVASSARGFIISDIRSMSEMMNPRALEATRTQGRSSSLPCGAYD